MKFRPGFQFWFMLTCLFIDLGMFVFSGNKIFFWLSVFCCVAAVICWKTDRFVFDYEQELLKKSFEKAKKKESEEDVDF